MYNKNFFIIEEDNNTSLIFIEKKFETLEGVIANLYSLRSKIELNKENLKCENLSNSNTIQNLVQKEYKMMYLNRELKENLVNINDYVKFINNEEIVYIILCDLKFNKEILNNINFNKIINLNVSKIENNFINKYSKIYNLIKFYE